MGPTPTGKLRCENAQPTAAAKIAEFSVRCFDCRQHKHLKMCGITNGLLHWPPTIRIAKTVRAPTAYYAHCDWESGRRVQRGLHLRQHMAIAR